MKEFMYKARPNLSWMAFLRRRRLGLGDGLSFIEVTLTSLVAGTGPAVLCLLLARIPSLLFRLFLRPS